MITEWINARPDGHYAVVASIPLSIRPVAGDMAEFELTDAKGASGTVLFQVLSCRWVGAQNQDGGGMTMKLQVIVTQVGVEQNASGEVTDEEPKENETE